MATFTDLTKQKEALARQLAALEQQIAQSQQAEKAGAVEKVRAIMAEFGLTVDDLQDSGKRGRKPSSKGSLAGSKVAAKYRDPSTGNAWSGRGLQPKWLKAALSEGRKIEEFSV